MKHKTGPHFRILIMTLLLIASLLSQVSAAALTQAVSKTVDEGAGIWQDTTMVRGQPRSGVEIEKPGGFQQDTSKAVPSLATPPASDNLKEDVKGPLPPPRGRAWTALMSENFEGVFPSGAWNVFDDDGATNGEYYWDDESYLPHTGAWSGWPAGGGANALDPALYFYPDNANSWMIYGPFDLSGCNSANFELYWWNQSELNFDWFFWGASGNGIDFDGTSFSGDSLGWVYQYFDLSAYLGDPSVYLSFVFTSDFSNVDDGAFIDDIVLWCNTGTSTTVEWSFLVYLDGDNNLESAGINDFLEMSSVGSSTNVNILVQFDRISGYDGTYDNWTDTRRFYITPGMQPTSANGTSIGEANMGHPQTLIDFVNWAKSAYPANHYALVLWDHGSGWKNAAIEQAAKDIAYDDTNGYDALNMQELRNTLSTLTTNGSDPFDILGMDACLMAMIEVDNQIRPFADVRVGSEKTIPNDGWPYDAFLDNLVANPSLSANQLATLIVDEYYASYLSSETESAVNLGSAYNTLNTAVNQLATALINNGGSYKTEIAAARVDSQEFDDPTYIDLYDFASEVAERVPNTAIDNATASVMSAVTSAVIRDRHGGYWPDAHGLTIYFPETASEYDSRYDGSQNYLQFTITTQWDEWLHVYYNQGSTFADVPPSYWAWQWIERLYATGITGGCATNPLQYCPEANVTRDQMAVFLERGIHGSSYTPPPVGASTGFNDVPSNYWSAAWIKQLAADGITGGCGGGNYCPGYPVTRAQMAVFLLKAKYGPLYTPPAVGASTGFNDVPASYWSAAWIKQLAAEGITGGCGTGNYCPENPVTRAQMAVFLVRTFNLP